jgi:hypothetical protein
VKLFALATAFALTIGAGTAGAASAQSTRVVTKTTTVERHTEMHRNNRGWTTKRVCRNIWTHHRKVRRCRMIRVRR